MQINFRMAIVFGVAICGFSTQLACKAQSTTPSSEKNLIPQAVAKTAPAQTDPVDLAAMEVPATGPGATASETPATTSATTNNASAATTAAPNSSSTSAASASVAVPLKSDAVIKELAEIKKQMAQMAQMEAAMKSRMEKLENVLNEADGAADADRNADALRSAASGDGTGSPSYGQAATTPPPALRPRRPGYRRPGHHQG